MLTHIRWQVWVLVHYVLFAVINKTVERVVLYSRPKLDYYLRLQEFLLAVGFAVDFRGRTVESGAAALSEEDAAACVDRYVLYQRTSVATTGTIEAAIRFQRALLQCTKLSEHLASSKRYFLGEGFCATEDGMGCLAGIVRLFAKQAKHAGAGWTEDAIQSACDTFQQALHQQQAELQPSLVGGRGRVRLSPSADRQAWQRVCFDSNDNTYVVRALPLVALEGKVGEGGDDEGGGQDILASQDSTSDSSNGSSSSEGSAGSDYSGGSSDDEEDGSSVSTERSVKRQKTHCG